MLVSRPDTSLCFQRKAAARMAAPCTMELFRHDGEKAQRMSIEQSEMAPTRRIEQDEEDVTPSTVYSIGRAIGRPSTVYNIGRAL